MTSKITMQLKGSASQVKWAERLRKRIFNYLTEGGRRTLTADEWCMIQTVQEAETWINARQYEEEPFLITRREGFYYWLENSQFQYKWDNRRLVWTTGYACILPGENGEATEYVDTGFSYAPWPV